MGVENPPEIIVVSTRWISGDDEASSARELPEVMMKKKYEIVGNYHWELTGDAIVGPPFLPTHAGDYWKWGEKSVKLCETDAWIRIYFVKNLLLCFACNVTKILLIFRSAIFDQISTKYLNATLNRVAAGSTFELFSCDSTPWLAQSKPYFIKHWKGKTLALKHTQKKPGRGKSFSRVVRSCVLFFLALNRKIIICINARCQTTQPRGRTREKAPAPSWRNKAREKNTFSLPPSLLPPRWRRTEKLHFFSSRITFGATCFSDVLDTDVCGCCYCTGEQ